VWLLSMTMLALSPRLWHAILSALRASAIDVGEDNTVGDARADRGDDECNLCWESTIQVLTSDVLDNILLL